MPDSPAPALFPVVRWSGRTVTFEPTVEPLPLSDIAAVVVFARARCGFVLADVPRWGWTTPSGRLEPGETPLQAALRETREEIGADLESPREIGRYRLTEETGRTLFVPTFAGTVRAFGAIPPSSESRGVRCAKRGELPALYGRWDALLERVFEFVEAELERSSEGNHSDGR